MSCARCTHHGYSLCPTRSTRKSLAAVHHGTATEPHRVGRRPRPAGGRRDPGRLRTAATHWRTPDTPRPLAPREGCALPTAGRGAPLGGVRARRAAVGYRTEARGTEPRRSTRGWGPRQRSAAEAPGGPFLYLRPGKGFDRPRIGPASAGGTGGKRPAGSYRSPNR